MLALGVCSYSLPYERICLMNESPLTNTSTSGIDRKEVEGPGGNRPIYRCALAHG